MPEPLSEIEALRALEQAVVVLKVDQEYWGAYYGAIERAMSAVDAARAGGAALPNADRQAAEMRAQRPSDAAQERGQ